MNKQTQRHGQDGREKGAELRRKQEGNRVGRDPEPDQGCPGTGDALKALLPQDEVILDAVEDHHLRAKEKIGQRRKRQRPAKTLGRECRQHLVIQQSLGKELYPGSRKGIQGLGRRGNVH